MTGIVLAVAATIVYNAGFICEKRALDRLPRIEAHRVWQLVRTLFTAPAWLAGFAMICCGLAIQVAVLSLEPLTVAQPLQACGVVVTLAFAWLVLHERLGRTELACVAAIGAAVLLLTLSTGTGAGAGAGVGAGAGAQVGTHVAAGAVAAAAIPVAVVIGACYGWLSRRGRNAVGFAFCAGLAYGYAGLAMKALSAAVFAAPRPGASAGTGTSAGTGVSGGAGIGIGARAVTDLVHAVTSPYLYVLLGVTAAGMCLFQVALQRGRAAIVMPVSLIMSTGYLVVVGSWLFHERLPASPLLLAMRLAGGLAAIAVPVILAVTAERRPAGATDDYPKGGAALAPGGHCRRRAQGAATEMSLDPLLLDLLACPIDKQALLYLPADGILYNPRLRRSYQVVDGIPVLLADQGETVTGECHADLLRRAATATAATAIAPADAAADAGAGPTAGTVTATLRVPLGDLIKDHLPGPDLDGAADAASA